MLDKVAVEREVTTGRLERAVAVGNTVEADVGINVGADVGANVSGARANVGADVGANVGADIEEDSDHYLIVQNSSYCFHDRISAYIRY